MPRYLVEAYGPGSETAVRDARDRAARVPRFAADVRHVRTTFLPEDEVILHFFEAPSAAALEQAGHRARLDFQRIVEAVEGEEGSA